MCPLLLSIFLGDLLRERGGLGFFQDGIEKVALFGEGAGHGGEKTDD